MSSVANVNIPPLLETRLARHFAEYAHCIDDERYEEWPDFFTEDCVYRVTTRLAVKRGHLAAVIDCDSRGMLIDRVNSLRHANIFEPHVYRHLIGLTRIVSVESGTVAARTGFGLMRTVAGQDSELFLAGVYDDLFQDRGNELKLTQRLVILDSQRIDTLLVLPI